jgi:hypothetical protein
MVTRSYLQSWANDRGLVHVWDSEAKVSGVRSLGSATVVSYAYRTEHTNLDLEAHFAGIEGRGAAAMKNIISGGTLNTDGREAIIDFLDMHLERGRYADQAAVKMPVAIANAFTGGVQMSEMGLGDRLTLSRDINKEALRISALRADRWPWRVAEVRSGLITGDGAVLIWERTKGSGVTTISFPLSPTRLLILGEELPSVPINAFILNNCRRWLIDHVEGSAARSMSS